MGEAVRITTKDGLKKKENQEKARKYTTAEIREGREVKVWAELDTS